MFLSTNLQLPVAGCEVKWPLLSLSRTKPLKNKSAATSSPYSESVAALPRTCLLEELLEALGQVHVIHLEILVLLAKG